jgi:hypothetical protein
MQRPGALDRLGSGAGAAEPDQKPGMVAGDRSEIRGQRLGARREPDRLAKIAVALGGAAIETHQIVAMVVIVAALYGLLLAGRRKGAEGAA